jgi:hypothetical protein
VKNQEAEPGIVTHACNPTDLGRKMVSQGCIVETVSRKKKRLGQ